MACGDGFECGFQKGERLDAVDLGGLDQRGDVAPGAAALIVTGEQRIFPVQGNRAHEIFDLVRVDLDAPIGQESLQSIPVAVDVGQLFAEPRFGRDAQALRLQPGAEGLDQRGGSRLACGQALTG